jgi:two-component system response regulator PilR (NtrC family)
VEQTPTLLPESLPPYVRPNGVGALMEPVEHVPPGLPDFPELQAGFDLEARGEDFYRHYIGLALERSGGVQTRAAELLGMSFRSFRYYAKKFNLR